MNIVTYPNAKLNIGLHILDKRGDGYHNIETLFFPYYNLTDILEIVESDYTGMYRYGLSYEGDIENDLTYKAYKLLQKDFDLPDIQIHLHKTIPTGAGLGGGSSDAAFTLTALNKLLSLSLSDSELAQYASHLGSDIPFFIYNAPMLGEGRGEILTPYSSESINELMNPSGRYKIEIITPDIHISTAEAYAAITPRNISGKSGASLNELLKLPIEEWRDNIVNDFEESIFSIAPQLRAIKESFYEKGAIYASMSGSGSSIYGVFHR